jgi:hypothetical protein
MSLRLLMINDVVEDGKDPQRLLRTRKQEISRQSCGSAGHGWCCDRSPYQKEKSQHGFAPLYRCLQYSCTGLVRALAYALISDIGGGGADEAHDQDRDAVIPEPDEMVEITLRPSAH